MISGETCRDCGKPLSRGATTGLCKAHFLARLNSALTPEQRSARMKAAMARDPALKKRHGDRLRAYTQTDAHREASRARLMASPKFQLAYTAAGPAGSPSRIRAGKRITAHRLAHIPEDARPTYLALRRKGVPRAEAEAAALAQLEHDLAQFRARLCPEGQRGAPMP